MKLDLDRYNDRIKQAGREILSDIKSEANAMGIVHRDDSPSNGSSVANMKDAYRTKDGAIDVISIKLRRSLIYPHKGAGKGKGGSKGSRWVDEFNIRHSTNPNSLGKMNTGKRKAKPFINNILDSNRGIGKIADIATEELGDAIVKNILVK